MNKNLTANKRIDNLKRELKNLRILRKMNKCKIREIKKRIRAERYAAKSSKASAAANATLAQYYDLAKRQAGNNPVETKVGLKFRSSK